MTGFTAHWFISAFSDDRGRHLKKLLSLLLALGILAGCGKKPAAPSAEPAVETPDADPYETRARGILETLSAREKLEQMMVIDARTFDGENMTVLSDEVRKTLEEHCWGGFILFSENVESLSKLVRLTSDLQLAAKENSGLPLLIGIDQEGGRVERMPFTTHLPGNMALGASGNPNLSKAAANITGMELSALGINTDFAPCADINCEPANPIIGLRSFSDSPTIVSDHSIRFYEGLKEAGIIACGKHFPGHGDTDTDSHTSLPVIQKTKEEAEHMELVPFAALAKAGVPMIMSAHIRFPEIESGEYVSKEDGETITRPATLSKAILTGILREEMGYQGVIVTDSMQMDEIKKHFDPCDAIVLAIEAGADLVLMPAEITDASSIETLNGLMDAVMARLGKDFSEERLDASVLRILKMKAEYGILDQSTDPDAMTEKAEDLVGSRQNHAGIRAIADQGVTVLRNEKDLLPAADKPRVLFAGVDEQQTAALKYGYEQIVSETDLALSGTFLSYEWGKDEEILQKIDETDLIVITSWLDSISLFDPEESGMIPFLNQVIETAHQKSKPVVVISTALPYDLPCYEEADALLAVYNPYGPPFDEKGDPTGESRPGIPAALDIIFGIAKPSGTLPVAVYKIENKKPGTETAFERGSGLTW